MKRFSEYLKEELEYRFLLEGLSASYDVNKLVSHLEKIIGDNIKDIQYTDLPSVLKETNYGNVFTVNIELLHPLSEIEKKKVSDVLDLFGYTESMMFLKPLKMQLEPKYPVKMNGFLEKYNDLELFHVTEKKYLRKIMGMGLAPKESKTTFTHPDNRIYFISILDPKNKARVLATWKNVLSRDKGLKSSDMVILRTHYNPSHNYFFDDTSSILNLGVIGIFSLNNVHPKDLEIITRRDGKDL